MTARLIVATLESTPNRLGSQTRLTFDFGFATLQTVSMTTEPELDDTGKDMECNKVTLEVAGVVNRVAIATNKPPGVSSAGVPGDDLAYTMANLRDFLMLPRLYIRFDMGGQKVLESPGRALGVDGQFFSSDVRGGPFPQSATYTRFAGAKLAFLHYRVVTYVTRCNKYVLSNRYTIDVSIDSDNYTTRTIHGSATFRKDFMAYSIFNLQADDFRQLLPPPCPPDMRRVSVHVNENSDGSELDYTVVDSETTYGMGRNSQVLEVTGTVTANAAWGITSLGDITGPLINRAGRRAVSAVRRDRRANARTRGNPANANTRMQQAGSAARAFGREVATTFVSVLPRGSIRGTCRATGRKGSNQVVLAQMAVNMLMDRMSPVWNPINGIGKCVAAALTFNLDSEHAPYAEATIQCIGVSVTLLAGVIRVDPVRFVNLSPTYSFNGVALASPLLPATELPNSLNTRGTWLGRMITQFLIDSATACSVIAPPPGNSPALDAPILA